MRILEKRRRDKLVSEPRKARSDGSESAEDVLQNAHVRNLLEDRAQAGHQLEYQSCCDKDGRKSNALRGLTARTLVETAVWKTKLEGDQGLLRREV